MWYYTLLRETCDRTDVSQEMLELLYNGIRDDLDDKQLENRARYPTKLLPLIKEQNKIRCDHLLLARFSKQWKSMQYQSLTERKINPTRSNLGTAWIRQLTTVIWKRIYQVWLERNLARHGKEEEEKSVCGSVFTKSRPITFTWINDLLHLQRRRETAFNRFRFSHVLLDHTGTEAIKGQHGSGS